MSYREILVIIHILVSVLLVLAILLQSKGVGLGSAFGGADYYQTKRGAERVIFIVTIFLGVMFSLTSFLNFLFL